MCVCVACGELWGFVGIRGDVLGGVCVCVCVACGDVW